MRIVHCLRSKFCVIAVWALIIVQAEAIARDDVTSGTGRSRIEPSVTVVTGTESDAASDIRDDGRMSTAKAIQLFEKRVQEDARDYLSLTVLGQLYLRDAKESDNLPAYAKAEETLRKALAIRPDHHSAMVQLAITLEARHQFHEALELASVVAASSERETLALATMGDCQLHLGLYSEAEVTYQQLVERVHSPAVLARIAHLRELKGQPDQAIAAVQDALNLCRSQGVAECDQAWYEMRLGTLHLSQGRLPEAETHFRATLKLSPNDAAGMTGLAEVLAALGRLDAAAQLYTAAIEKHGEPMAMAGLGDVLQKQGNAAAAAEWYKKAEQLMAEEALTAAAAHYREVAMFLADHDLQHQRAVELAELDLKQRQDLHAYDTLAWTLYRAGQFDRASTAIQSAMKLGTRDARLYFHAGMIQSALGRTADAIQSLKTTLEINPHFSLLHAEAAAAELKRLEAQKSSAARL